VRQGRERSAVGLRVERSELQACAPLFLAERNLPAAVGGLALLAGAARRREDDHLRRVTARQRKAPETCSENGRPATRRGRSWRADARSGCAGVACAGRGAWRRALRSKMASGTPLTAPTGPAAKLRCSARAAATPRRSASAMRRTQRLRLRRTRMRRERAHFGKNAAGAPLRRTLRTHALRGRQLVTRAARETRKAVQKRLSLHTRRGPRHSAHSSSPPSAPWRSAARTLRTQAGAKERVSQGRCSAELGDALTENPGRIALRAAARRQNTPMRARSRRASA
jgi:hypothetical protein